MSISIDSVWTDLARTGVIVQADQAPLAEQFAATPLAERGVRGLFEWLCQKQIITPYQAAALAGDARRPLSIGAYLIRERISRGRLAGVYRARHATLGFPVCLRIIKPQGSPGEVQSQLIRLQREVRITAQVQHSAVLRTYQVGKIGEAYFLAFENLQGQTLLELLDANSIMDSGVYSYAISVWDLQRGEPSVDVVCRLIREAALGLAHLHEQEIVHRDISPEHLWVTDGGHVKLIDFGLARDALTHLDAPQADLLAAGDHEFLGSPEYLSPEQALESQAATPVSDIYSLGCTLYHALSGRTPFAAPSGSKQVLMHATQTAPPPSQFNREIPPELDRIVLKMMAKRPEDRYQSALAVADALESFIHASDHVLDEQPSSERLDEFLAWLNEQGGAEIDLE